jgi:lipopolysaccharide transport system permease protein
MASKQYYTHISSKHKMFDLKLKEVWQYRDLIWLFTKRSFTVTYKQTVLGPAWLFISPIFTSFIYTFVFGGIAGMDTDGIPQILFYLSGNAMWNLFSSTLKNNSSTFTANSGVFGKVYFPRLTTPISVVMSSIIKFFIHCLLVVLVLGYYVITGLVSPHWEVIWVIPLVLIQLSLMGMGLGIIISSMTTKYRDLSVLVGFGVELLMYATPIVYPLSQLDADKLKIIVMLNPVTMPMEVYRYALLGQGTISALYLLISILFTFVVLIFGIMVFNKVERTFMDTV